MRSAAAWVLLYLAFGAAPLVVLLVWGELPGRGFVWDVSIALGLAGTMMLGVQFALTARFRRATAPFGIDIITYFHRYAGIAVFAILLAHPILIFVEDPAYLAALDPRRAPLHMTAGAVSMLAIAALMITSLGRKALRIGYDGWRHAHVLLAVVAVAAALHHVHGVAYYTASPPLSLLWPASSAAWLMVVAYVRVVRPLLELAKPWRVIEVRAERGDAWTVALEPANGSPLSFEPGQFAWLSLRSRPIAMRDHPFSISSSAERPQRLEFTIKELGDFTRTISGVQAGETAYVDGPYGAFTIDRHAGAPVFVAGGIGIAPIMSMLRTLADRGDSRACLLFFAYRRWERLTFREEIERLRERMRLRVVYVLEEPPRGWEGATGRITRDLLDRELPRERARLQYFVCGPEAMLHSVEEALHRLGVPLGRVHSELFDLV